MTADDPAGTAQIAGEAFGQLGDGMESLADSAGDALPLGGQADAEVATPKRLKS